MKTAVEISMEKKEQKQSCGCKDIFSKFRLRLEKRINKTKAASPRITSDQLLSSPKLKPLPDFYFWQSFFFAFREFSQSTLFNQDIFDPAFDLPAIAVIFIINIPDISIAKLKLGSFFFLGNQDFQRDLSIRPHIFNIPQIIGFI